MRALGLNRGWPTGGSPAAHALRYPETYSSLTPGRIDVIGGANSTFDDAQRPVGKEIRSCYNLYLAALLYANGN
jgi:hypothetical protein